MSTVDIVGLLVPVTYFVFLLTEQLWPARQFPPRRGWQWIGLAFLMLVMTISTVIPLLIPEAWLEQYRLIDGTILGGADRLLHRVQQLLPALERPHPAMDRLFHPAAGSALRPPPAGFSLPQLRRPLPVRHAVRHVPQPA